MANHNDNTPIVKYEFEDMLGINKIDCSTGNRRYSASEFKFHHPANPTDSDTNSNEENDNAS
jgi:hypothetical protein